MVVVSLAASRVMRGKRAWHVTEQMKYRRKLQYSQFQSFMKIKHEWKELKLKLK